MAPDVTLVHMSDLHIALDDPGGFLGLATVRRAREVIAAVRALELPLDGIVISGDLIDAGYLDYADQVTSYRRTLPLVEELGAQGVPVLLALGDHDQRAAFFEVIRKEGGADAATPLRYGHDIAGLRVIVLDSKVPGAGYGELGEAQLAWLDKELARAARPAVLVLHHPVLPDATPWPADDDQLRDRDLLGEIVARRRVAAILSGHVHFCTVGAFHGATAASAPGVAFGIDPTSRQRRRFTTIRGFNLIVVRDSAVAVHPIILPGPHTELTRRDAGHGTT